MRIDFGLILALVLECIFFIYYAETLFYCKVNRILCYAAITVGYAIYFFVCTSGNMAINTTAFFVLNCAALLFLYHISLKNALFQGAILTVLSAASEIAIVYIDILGIDINGFHISVAPMHSMILTVAGKTLYLVGIMIITHIFAKKKNRADMRSISLMFVPIFTVIILIFMMKIVAGAEIMAGICVLLIVINLIVFSLNQNLTIAQTETEYLRQQTVKDKIDFEEYSILKEKSEQMRIFRHDFKEHMSALDSLIDDDNEKAKEYIKLFYNEGSKSQFVEYTDNKMLNIILTKKKDECEKQGIRFIIEPVQTSLKIFNDMDTVSIFSNLINNAIESSTKSKKKKIFFTAYASSGNFIVIKIENTADQRPLIIDGKLKTHKDNAELHGIGMNSIRRAVKNYNGVFDWKYDKEQRIFSSVITVQK